MQTVKLSNGVEMPVLGFGVYQIPDHDECKKAVSEAIQVGYRLIDTATSYFNEKAVGEAIRESGIPREDFFVTTKLWVQDHGYDATLRAFDASMEKLGLETLDLWLIHKPYGDYYGSWHAMERLYKEGRVRAIGVTSFPDDRLLDLILHTEVKPMVNQVETNPWCQMKATADFLASEGIVHEAWAPFAEGKNGLFTNPVLVEIAKKHGKTVGQVVLRWLLQRNVVVIPKSVHRERMVENLDVFSFELDAAEMAQIAALDTGKSQFYDDRALAIVRWIGNHKIHE